MRSPPAANVGSRPRAAAAPCSLPGPARRYGAFITLEQGDLRLLETDLAQRLLTATIPARYACTALDGTPRIVSSWFAWTGDELVLPTFIAGPHVSHFQARMPSALGGVQ